MRFGATAKPPGACTDAAASTVRTTAAASAGPRSGASAEVTHGVPAARRAGPRPPLVSSNPQGGPMPFLVAAVVLFGLIATVNLLLTIGVVRRLREQTTE